MTPKQIKSLTVSTSNAYSAAHYTSWASVIRMLAKRGYSELEINAIVRSKWTRWARDACPQNKTKYSAKDLERYLDNPKNNCTKEEVVKLIGQTSISSSVEKFKQKYFVGEEEWNEFKDIVARETTLPIPNNVFECMEQQKFCGIAYMPESTDFKIKLFTKVILKLYSCSLVVYSRFWKTP